jgi:ketosteroid isomerase-like protein
MPAVLRAAAACVALSACAAAPSGGGAVTRAEVAAVLDEQVAAWNRGDLDAFMAGYWRDAALSFVGARGVTRGWDRVLAGYRRGYPDADARGTLSFELLEVRPLGASHALVLGCFSIAGRSPAAGFFTLVLARRPEGLRIVHDHTSAETPPAR